MKIRGNVAFVDVQLCAKNKSTSYNLHGFAHIGTLYIPMQGENALTDSSAAAAGAEWDNGFFSTDARYSKSKEALHLKQRQKQREEGGWEEKYILKKHSYSVHCPYSLLFPVRG